MGKTLSRRTVLSATAASAVMALPVAAAALTVAAPAITASGNTGQPSEPLIALYDEWRRAYAEHDAACTRRGEVDTVYFAALARGGDPDLEALRLAAEKAAEASGAACDRQWALAEQIGLVLAQGYAGVFVKLCVAASAIRDGHIDGSESNCPIERLIVRAATDAERITGWAPS